MYSINIKHKILEWKTVLNTYNFFSIIYEVLFLYNTVEGYSQ